MERESERARAREGQREGEREREREKDRERGRGRERVDDEERSCIRCMHNAARPADTILDGKEGRKKGGKEGSH